MALEVSPEQEEDGLRLRPGAGYSEVRLGRCPGAEKDKQQILGDLETPPGGWRLKPALGLMRESEEAGGSLRSCPVRGPEKQVVGGNVLAG